MDKGDLDGRAYYLNDTASANLEDRVVFASLARRGREITGKSLQDIAKKMGTAPGTISRWENGHSAPPLVSRKKLINLFKSYLINPSR